jgi:hypothetical protein
MSLWLSAAEVCDLTGYKHKNSQKSALGKMGIPFVSRALDGFPMVQRAQFQGQLTALPMRRKEPKLDWLKQA